MAVYRTSGSTGVPKVFTLSSEQEKSRAASLPITRGIGFSEITGLFISHATDSSASTRHRDWILSKGGKFFGPQKDMDENVALILREKPNGIFGAPGFMVNLAKRINRQHEFDYVGVGSDRLSPDQSKEIRAGLGDNLWAVYSTSETNTIALASGEQIEKTPGCVGSLCAGVEIRFTDGVVQVKTPTMITGYDDPFLTDEYFQDGWFWTGDFGHMTDGLLILTGRAPRRGQRSAQDNS